MIVSGSDDQTVRLWDLQTGEPALGRSPATTARCTRWRSPSGTAGRPVIVSGSDRTVRVWDLESERHVTLRIEFQHRVLSVASGADQLVVGTTAGLLRVGHTKDARIESRPQAGDILQNSEVEGYAPRSRESAKLRSTQ